MSFFKDDDENEDTTKYGEFISSYFGWITMNKQKQRAKELEDISNNSQKRKNVKK